MCLRPWRDSYHKSINKKAVSVYLLRISLGQCIMVFYVLDKNALNDVLSFHCNFVF